jgi:hypothetical protein
MTRKAIVALFALAAVGLVQPTVASARGGGGVTEAAVAVMEATEVAFTEASLVGSTVEDFTADFTGVGLWGLALGPTTTDTIPTHTTTTTMTAAATLSIVA